MIVMIVVYGMKSYQGNYAYTMVKDISLSSMNGIEQVAYLLLTLFVGPFENNVLILIMNLLLYYALFAIIISLIARLPKLLRAKVSLSTSSL